MSVNPLKIVVLSLYFYSNIVFANPMNNFPVPPRTDNWWVANGNIHNGHQIFIKKIKSQQAPSKVAEFYKNRWGTTEGVPGYMQNEEAGWQLVSRLTAEYQWVVQVRDSDSGRGSEGFISAMRLVTSSSFNTTLGSRQSKFTNAIRGGELISSTESNEPSQARTQLHLYPRRPTSIANQYKSHMTSKGWSLQDEYEHQGTIAQRFEHARRQIDLAFVPHQGGKTLVFLNEVQSHEN